VGIRTCRQLPSETHPHKAIAERMISSAQYGDNALLEIAIHCCQSERSTIGEIIARPSRADAVNDGDGSDVSRVASIC
jgi:hypothetical protein